MKKFAALVLALALVLPYCAAMAEGSIVKSYIYGAKEDTAEERFALNAYQLHLYDDGTYVMIKTTCSYGYSMQLSTAAVTTYGTYTQGEDGYMPVTLTEATRVIVNSYSKLGGFDIHIDTALTDFSVIPELPAQ